MLPKILSTNLYLVCTKPDDIGQLLDDQVNALNAGLFKSGNLLFDDGLEGHVGGEQTHADT
jgi:hypothetical protein